VKLTKLNISNWKSISHEIIDLENLMIFIGQNNSGKSNILSSILYFFKQGGYKEKFCFDNRFPIKIIATFKDISNREISIKKISSINREEYFIKNKKHWEKLSYPEFHQFFKNYEILFIPSEKPNSNRVVLSFFKKIKKSILEKLNDKRYHEIKKSLDPIFKNFEKTNFSHGKQRYTLFSLISLLAKISKEYNINFLENKIILYEEPEIYLHPQGERELYDSFITLSKLGGQLFVSTHSATFIGLRQYKSICIVRRNSKEAGTKVFQCKENLFYKDEIKNFNMNYWINPDRSELFFAEKVLLVEGQTDKILIPFLAKKIGCFKYNYSLIECGSKSSIPQFIRLLQKFSIPYVAIFDRDFHSHKEKNVIENSKRQNSSIIKKINKKLGDYIIFNNDIEEELNGKEIKNRSFKHKPYTALQMVSKDDFIIPDILKEKIRRIYL